MGEKYSTLFVFDNAPVFFLETLNLVYSRYLHEKERKKENKKVKEKNSTRCSAIKYISFLLKSRGRFEIPHRTFSYTAGLRLRIANLLIIAPAGRRDSTSGHRNVS